MNLWFRLLLLHLTLRRARRVDLLDDVPLTLRVWPTDLDIQAHVNNGRYLSLMDLGRFALMARTGLLEVASRERWMPLVRAISMEYFKPLMPWQRFTLHTRLCGWDHKWLYLEQSFVRDGTVCARGRIRGLFRSREGNVPPSRLLAAIGEPERVSPDPGWATDGD